MAMVLLAVVIMLGLTEYLDRGNCWTKESSFGTGACCYALIEYGICSHEL